MADWKRGLLGAMALLVASHAAASGGALGGRVFDDRDGDGMQDAGEPGIPGVALSNGIALVRSDGTGSYRLPAEAGQIVFAIKPAGWAFATRADGLPSFWRQATADAGTVRFDVPLRRVQANEGPLQVLVFGDPQVKSEADVDYYARDIVDDAMRRGARAGLGISLGDIVDDAPSLYPSINAQTARLRTPWLHAAGNHDVDADASRDEDALRSFRGIYGPDTFAWEEAAANIVVLDDVIHLPGGRPAYIGGLREDQFAFLEAYLREAPKQRLLVLAMHIPLFEPTPGRDTFRDADRARLFAMLAPFPRVLVLSAHTHGQRHWMHDAETGWQGAAPLHEYNIGAAAGAYWSGAKDAQGIPDSTMADGTPNGYAWLRIAADATYSLAWRNARDADDAAIGLHAPKVLRRGAYPGWAVYANVYMGREDTRVEYRIDGGAWRAMTRTPRADPRLLAENARDDAAEALRGYDRSPEAEPSPHLWRGALPTDLPTGTHRIEVRAFDPWRGEVNARGEYRLEEAAP